MCSRGEFKRPGHNDKSLVPFLYGKCNFWKPPVCFAYLAVRKKVNLQCFHAIMFKLFNFSPKILQKSR